MIEDSEPPIRTCDFSRTTRTSATVLFASPNTHAANLETQNYRRAFALIDAGRADQAISFAAHGRDPLLNKILRGYYMALPGNDTSFAESAAFISRNPGWPRLREIAEKFQVGVFRCLVRGERTQATHGESEAEKTRRHGKNEEESRS